MEKIEFRFFKNNTNFTIQKNKYENMVFFYEQNNTYGYFNYLIKDCYEHNSLNSLFSFNACFNIFKEKRDNNYWININSDNDFIFFEKELSVYDILEKSNTVFTIDINYEEFICNFLNKLKRNNDKEKMIVIHLGKEKLSEKMKNSIIESNKKGYFVIFYVHKDSIGFDCDLFHMKFEEKENYIIYKYRDNKLNILYMNKEEDYHEVHYNDNLEIYKKVDYLNFGKILINF